MFQNLLLEDQLWRNHHFIKLAAQSYSVAHFDSKCVWTSEFSSIKETRCLQTRCDGEHRVGTSPGLLMTSRSWEDTVDMWPDKSAVALCLSACGFWRPVRWKRERECEADEGRERSRRGKTVWNEEDKQGVHCLHGLVNILMKPPVAKSHRGSSLTHTVINSQTMLLSWTSSLWTSSSLWTLGFSFSQQNISYTIFPFARLT